MFLETRGRRRRLEVQGEGGRSKKFVSSSSFSSNQVSTLPCGFIDLFFVTFGGFWSKNPSMRGMDVPRACVFRYSTIKGCYGIKVQALCH